MKLPNFIEYNLLNSLREKMGAELKSWHPNLTWNSFDPDEWRRLQNEGIEVPIDEVIPANDRTLEYRGEKVVLYIRDQHISGRLDGTPGDGYRFHVTDCKTLRGMRDIGKYERYVVSNRKDGKFIVNRLKFGVLIEKGTESEIPVCKNCLRILNFNNYSSASSIDKNTVWLSFNLIEYFDKYSTKITVLPKHSAETAPINIYSDNWDEISDSYRNHVNWICEKCKIDLSKYKRFLHVHHRNMNKSDNRTENLQALCIECHARMPNHEHIKNLPDHAQFISNRVLGNFRT